MLLIDAAFAADAPRRDPLPRCPAAPLALSRAHTRKKTGPLAQAG